MKIKGSYNDSSKYTSWKVLETVLSHYSEISSEIVLQPLLFVADVDIDDEEIKQGVPDPPKLDELLDSQEEGTEDDSEEQVNKKLPPDGADSDMEGKLSDTNEERSINEPCGGCAI